MHLLGEKLRRARLEQGLTLGELAARTKVGVKFLEAIEADRRDQLPGNFFFKNWTLQYARALALNEQEFQHAIDDLLRSEAPLPLPGQQQPLSVGSKRLHITMRTREKSPRLLFSFGLLIVVVLGCSGLYAWWHRQAQEQPVITAASTSAPAVVPKNTPVSAELEPRPPAPARDKREVTETPAPTVAIVSSEMLLEIFAREPTWLSISPDGKQVFSGVLKPNESKRIAAKESARLKVGNAGGLEVRLNGKPLGDIGPKGRVRVVFIKPDGIQIVGPRTGLKPVA